MDARILEDIGLSAGEAKVYLALVKLGVTKTGRLASEAGVSSSKVYKILDRLIRKGLVGYVTRGKTKHFSALEPCRVVDYVEEREKELHEKTEQVKKLLPILERERNSGQPAQAVVYDGFKAVSNFFRGMLDELKAGDEYCVIGATYGDAQEIRPFFYQHHRRRAAKGIRLKMLANYDQKNRLEKTTMRLAEIRYLPQYLITNMEIVFYKNRTFIVLWTKNPTGFLIESDDAVKSFRAYFNTFWKIARRH